MGRTNACRAQQKRDRNAKAQGTKAKSQIKSNAAAQNVICKVCRVRDEACTVRTSRPSPNHLAPVSTGLSSCLTSAPSISCVLCLTSHTLSTKHTHTHFFTILSLAFAHSLLASHSRVRVHVNPLYPLSSMFPLPRGYSWTLWCTLDGMPLSLLHRSNNCRRRLCAPPTKPRCGSTKRRNTRSTHMRNASDRASEAVRVALPRWHWTDMVPPVP